MARSGLMNAVRASRLFIPPTVMTSCTSTAWAFWTAHGEEVLSGPPRFPRTTRLTGPQGREQLFSVTAGRPIYLQAILDGSWQRVLVVGDAVFAYGVEAETLIPEAHPRPASDSVALTPAESDRLRHLGHLLGLAFFEVLLLRRSDNKSYCYFINDMPDAAWYDPSTHEHVGQAIIQQCLCFAERRAA